MNRLSARSRSTTFLSSTLVSVAFAAALGFSSGASAADTYSAGCQPALKSTRTDFPALAVQAGAHGVARVRLTIGADGRASAVSIDQSSGVAALDRAALSSVQKHWLFDVTNCSAADLAREQTVNVEFKRSKAATLHATLDAKSVAEARALRANQQCHARDLDNGATVFSCAVTAAQLEARTKVAGSTQQAAR